MGLLRSELLQAEVVDDQKDWSDQLEQFTFQRVIGSGGVQNLEHFCRLYEKDALFTSACGVSQGVSKEGLTNTDGAGHDDVFFALHPLKAHEPLEAVAVKSYCCAPVEALKHFIMVNFGIEQAPGKCPLVSSLDLIGEDHLQ